MLAVPVAGVDRRAGSRPMGRGPSPQVVVRLVVVRLALAAVAAAVGLLWQAPGAASRVEPSPIRGRPTCAYERAHGFFIAICSEMELTEVPVLRSDITVFILEI